MANEVRLINYYAAIDRYYAEYEKQDICDGAQDRDWLKKCFDEAPTIEPDSLRPKGRWENVQETVMYVPEMKYTTTHTAETCSVCKARVGFVGPKVYLYDQICPSCGAKMRGEADD